MKKLPIVLTLLLTAVWAYTCWYWFTCNIKGFCGDETTITHIVTTQEESTTNFEGSIPKDDSIFQNNNTGSVVVETIEENDSPKLSAEDVLFDPLPKEVSEDRESESQSQGDEITQTGSIVEEEPQEIKEDIQRSESSSICDSPLVGPIAIGAANNSSEVEKLEAFLISRGERISIDGNYGNDDFEAMKRFQTEYKAEVLEPWGITQATGYVGKTSIAKVNELACK